MNYTAQDGTLTAPSGTERYSGPIDIATATSPNGVVSVAFKPRGEFDAFEPFVKREQMTLRLADGSSYLVRCRNGDGDLISQQRLN